jgi:protein-S-isoprenylcysteine O-methyltransferase Ste14
MMHDGRRTAAVKVPVSQEDEAIRGWVKEAMFLSQFVHPNIVSLVSRSVSVAVCVCVCLWLCVSVTVAVCLWLCVCVCGFVWLWLCLCVCESLYPCVCVSGMVHVLLRASIDGGVLCGVRWLRS